MELSQLKYFACAAEENNFTHAAEKLFVTPSALNRSVAALEEEVGFKLFDRNKKKVALNEDGKIFLEQARKVLEAQRELENLARTIKRGDSSLKVISSYRYALTFVVPYIDTQYTDGAVEYEVVEEDGLLEKLINNEADIALVTQYPKDPKIVAYPLYTENTMLVVKPMNPLYRQDKISIKDLDGQTLVLSKEYMNSMDKGLAYLSSLGINIKISYEEGWLLYSDLFQDSPFLGVTSNVEELFYPARGREKHVPIAETVPTWNNVTFYFTFLASRDDMAAMYVKIKDRIKI